MCSVPTPLSVLVFATLVLACVTPSFDKTGAPECEEIDGRKRACPVERISPRYPRKASEAGGEAMVLVSFSILEDGSTDDILVAAILGHTDFGEAAVRAVEQWRYEPALVDGTRVGQAGTKVVMPFTIRRDGGDRGAKKPFVRRFNRALAALAAGDTEFVRNAVSQLEADPWPNLYEMSRLALLKAQLAALDEDWDAVVELLGNSTVQQGRFIGPKLYLDAMGKKIRTLLRVDRYGDAHVALANMEETLKGSIPPDLEAIRDELERIRLGSAPFILAGEIGSRATSESRAAWSYTPLRRAFAIEAFETGTLDDVTVSCDWHREVLEPIAGRLFVMPESWGNCRVIVYGEPGSRFELVEHSPI